MSLRSFARAAANPVAGIAVAIALVGGTGAATAATGGTFLLGRSNAATTTTSLTNSAGTALSLNSKAGTPPLAVNSTTRVARLNADLLDGLTAGDLQRRVAGTCATGAIKAIGATGNVACAALPGKINVSTASGVGAEVVRTAVATVAGVTLNVDCEVYDVGSMEGPRLRMTAYFTGSVPALANGHATSTPYTGTTTVDPVGSQVPAAGTGAALPVLDAPELAVSRQSATVMVAHGTTLTQWTLHLFADGRQFGDFAGPNGKPCTVWGTTV